MATQQGYAVGSEGTQEQVSLSLDEVVELMQKYERLKESDKKEESHDADSQHVRPS